FTQSGLAVKGGRALADDLQMNFGLRGQWLRADKNAGAEAAALRVDFSLRQIERILALDVARTHVITDRVADDPAERIDDQRQLRLGHVPLRVATDAHLLIRARYAVGRGFKEQLGAVGGIDAVIKVSAASRFRFLHSRRPAAEISYARRPDLLPA